MCANFVTELENLNAKLENLTGSTTHSLIANYSKTQVLYQIFLLNIIHSFKISMYVYFLIKELSGKSTHNYLCVFFFQELWRCEWTGQYFIVQNLALHTLETIVTVDHPKTAHHYSFELQLSEYFKWRVPLFEKINYNQQDVYVQEVC